ncbi:hypothetical protein F444_12412 [Phytophthora nicotianae P1976]|uniref:Uncharacterized protein n=1 Tax=Phytophthora nicotianae P1976 TaxID=1317066 RepID=A0A080ZX81_PHYNI|nr:hypothetical protein F444_12412 [Phytophthora nicotianae P1976]
MSKSSRTLDEDCRAALRFVFDSSSAPTDLTAMLFRAAQLSCEASSASVSTPAASRTISTVYLSIDANVVHGPKFGNIGYSVTKSAPAVSLTTMSSATAPAPAFNPSASSSAIVESHHPSAAIPSHLPAPRLSEIEGTALHGLLMDAAEETSDRIVAVFGSRITEAVRCLVQLMINPPQPGDPVRNRAIAAAALVDDRAAAVSNPASYPRDLAAEIGDLKATLTDARLTKLIATHSVGEKHQKLTDLETRFMQSRANCSSLEQALAAETKQRITAEEQITALASEVRVHDEVVLNIQKALEAANEARASQSRKINRYWQLYQKNPRIYADRLERFHRYLTERGQSVENLDQKIKRKILKDELRKVLLVNKYLRKFVNDRDLDPDALLLLLKTAADLCPSAGSASGCHSPVSAPVTPVPASSTQKSTQPLPMPPLAALLTPVDLAAAQSSSPKAKTTSQPALNRSRSSSSVASTVNISPSSPEISSAASPGPNSAPDSSQNTDNLDSTLRWSPMAPRSRSTRTAAAISRWVTSQVIAQESDKSSVFIGAPGQTPPASPRGASDDEHEESKENEMPSALQLQALEDTSSTVVSSRTRSAYRPIPMSALGPSHSAPPPAPVQTSVEPVGALAAAHAQHQWTTIPVVKLPAPIEGWQPLMQPSKKIPAKVQRYLKPNFQRKGALRCWNLVHSFRTPLPVVKGLVAACSVEGIRAFADWTKTEHPWRIVDKMFPDVANSFDVSPFVPDVFVSLHAPKRARTVKLWRQTHGFNVGGKESDVGWERGHWVVQSEIEATVRRLAKTHGNSSSTVRDVTRAMDAYLSDRNRRADKFRNKIM